MIFSLIIFHPGFSLFVDKSVLHRRSLAVLRHLKQGSLMHREYCVCFFCMYPVDLQELVQKKILKEVGEKKGRWYQLI